MNKQFNELPNGSRFILNGNEYVKIQEVKVSCCKTINAQLVADGNNKIYVQPATQVVINA